MNFSQKLDSGNAGGYVDEIIHSFYIDSLNQSGQGVGRLGDLVVFVDGGIPGDRVTLKVTEKHRHYWHAEVLAIESPSPERIEPFCPVAGTCGGCALQSLAYTAQLKWKTRQVSDQLERIGRIKEAVSLTRPALGMAQPDHYRNKVQFPVSGSREHPLIGFYARRSHQVVDTDRCDIQHPTADVVRHVVREHLLKHRIQPYQESLHTGLLRHILVRTGFGTGQVMVVLVINGSEYPGLPDLIRSLEKAIPAEVPGFALTSLFIGQNTDRTNVILGSGFRKAYGQDHIEEIILGLRFRISPASFFQVNPYQTGILYQEVLHAASLHGTETVLDLYCGTGSISLLLAQAARRVIGVETVAAAIEDARLNAQANQVTDVEFHVGLAESWLADYFAAGGHADVVVIDPPRRGCDAKLIASLNLLEAQRLVYVSCNPATLARDLALLQPVWSVKQIQPVDLFPWSDSVECVVRLERNQ